MQIKKTILTESFTLEEFRKIIREGRAAEVLAVGDQIYIDFDGAAVPYDVIGIDADTPAAEELKHTVTIQAHELIEEHPFDTKGRYGSNDWHRTRSANRGNSYRTWYVTSSGYVDDHGYAYYYMRCAPACAIG